MNSTSLELYKHPRISGNLLSLYWVSYPFWGTSQTEAVLFKNQKAHTIICPFNSLSSAHHPSPPRQYIILLFQLLLAQHNFFPAFLVNVYNTIINVILSLRSKSVSDCQQIFSKSHF